MPDKSALFDWLAETLDELPEQATVTLRVNGNSINAEVVTVRKKVDNAGRIVIVEETITTHLRIARKGRVLNLA